MTDVVVVGGGAAGVAAALAARKGGASVTLVSAGHGATSLFGGAVDHGEVDRPEELEEALRLLDPIFEDEPVEPTRPLRNHLGEALPAGPALAAHRGGRDLEGKRVGVLLPSFVPAYRDGWLGDPGDLEAVPMPVTVEEWPGERIGDPLAAAKLLEEEGLRGSLARAVERAVSSEIVDSLAFPPILGLSGSSDILAQMEEAAGVPCFETLATAPSAPGLRLAGALEGLLAERGVTIASGRATRVRTEKGCVREVLLGGDMVLQGDTFVLAGGTFVGGGLRHNGRPSESLLGLPLFIDGAPVEDFAPEDLYRRSFSEPQPLFRAGVRVDHLMRPLDRGAEPIYGNLFAAGSILSGLAIAEGGGGLGVALATGLRAGRAATGEEIA